MQEAIELLLNYLRGIWIKRWILVLVAWLVCLVGWAFVIKMPDQYQSEAKVYVDTESMLSPLLRGLTIRTDPQQQVQLMVRTLFTRPNLEKIARLADLDIQAESETEFEVLIDELRSGLNLDRSGRENIYSIRYRDSSPQLARDVVQSTLTTLVENTLGDKREDTDAATDFLDRQIASYEERLNAADSRLKEFKKQNYEFMGSGSDYYGRMEQLKSEISRIELELREARARRNSVKSQLEGETPSFGLMPDSLANPQGFSTPYDSRIASLQQRLDELSLQYTDRHPDIKETKRVLSDLEAKRDKELEALKAQRQANNSGRSSSVDENPVYQQLKMALNSEESTIQTLQVRLTSKRAEFQKMQQKIDTIPEIEARLKELQRGYSITQSKYNELLSRRESARLSSDVDSSADGFQFRVIDPPRVPDSPTGPNRPLFLTGVLVAALGAGVGLAFIFSQLRPVFFSARQLSAVTGYPVLGSVSVVPEQIDNRQRKRRHWYTMLMLILLAIFAGLMALQLKPQLNQQVVDALPDIPTLVDELITQLKILYWDFMKWMQ